MPMPKGSRFWKIAAAVRLAKGVGMQVGKTFDSRAGGETSAESFYTRTLAGVAVVIPSLTNGSDLDYKMVETWYPNQAASETTSCTAVHTTLSAFEKWANHTAVRPAV